MKDYERKFFLPFKGLTKPVYAIPGNHDWYDALDAFVATFFEPEAAKKAIYARVKSDLKVTTTTPRVVESIVEQAAFLRRNTTFQQDIRTLLFFRFQMITSCL